MTNFKTRCGYIGCEPLSGQCLGFCGESNFTAKPKMPVQFAGPEPEESNLDFDFTEEDDSQDENGGMQMLAYAVLITMAACVVLGVLYAVYR